MIGAPDFRPMIASVGSIFALLERRDLSAGAQQAVIEFSLLFAKDRSAQPIILSLSTFGADEQAIVVEPSKAYLDRVSAVARELEAHGAKIVLESVHGFPVVRLAGNESEPSAMMVNPIATLCGSSGEGPYATAVNAISPEGSLATRFSRPAHASRGLPLLQRVRAFFRSTLGNQRRSADGDA